MTIAGPPNTQRPREHLRPSSPRAIALSTVTGASTRLFPRSPLPFRTSVPHATQQAVLCAFHRPSPVSMAGSTISATMTISVPGFDAASPRVLPWCPTFTRKRRPCSPVFHRSTNGSGFRPASGPDPRSRALALVCRQRFRRDDFDCRRLIGSCLSGHVHNRCPNRDFLLDSRSVPNAFPVWQAAPIPLPFPHDQHPIASTSRTPNSTLLQSPNDCFGNL